MYYDEEDYSAEAYLDDALKSISEDNTRAYLGVYGDAIEERVQDCLKQAEELLSTGYNGPALALAATAVELMIRFMLLRPLIEGAFLSEEWAEILATRVATGRSAEDRELLPAVLQRWRIDIATIRTPGGFPLWEFVLKELWPKRHNFVHKGERPSREIAATAIECARCFKETVIGAIAMKLGFTRARTGKWCEIDSEDGSMRRFGPQSPF
ncbi:MAG: hypothetical protein ACOYXR_04385 [Nitrospirota bacterium]